MSRPIPQLLLPRRVHLSQSAEHHIFEDLASEIWVGEQNSFLYSKDRGQALGKVLVDLVVCELHSMCT